MNFGDKIKSNWSSVAAFCLLTFVASTPTSSSSELGEISFGDVIAFGDDQTSSGAISEVSYQQVQPRITVRDDLTSQVFPYPELDLAPIFDVGNAHENVVLVRFRSSIALSSGYCTGTIVNQRTVLTAAHCIQNLADDLGVPDGNLQPRIYFAPDALPDLLAGNYLSGTSHVVHNDYDRTAFFLGSDIALVSLAQPVSRSARPGLINGISYAQLATSDPSLFEEITLVGYGTTGIGSDPGVDFDVKRRVATNQVDYIGPSDDVLGGGGTGQLVFADFADPTDIAGTDYFCFFFWGGPSCTVTPSEGTTDQGDSGGPIFVSDGSGGFIQVGVTSGGGNACGGPSGGYCDIAFWTSVAAFNSWIQTNSPLKTVSSLAGNSSWTNAAHWSGGLVPDNFDTPVSLITDYTNAARYFNVNLAASGTTTLSDAREIDELDISGAGANLTIAASGNLFVWSQTTLTAGTLRVDGTLDTEYLDVLGGRVQGTGSIVSAADFAGNFGGTVAPGNSIGTLNIVGDYVQGVGGILEIEVTNGASDLLAITGNATLAGTLQVKQFGAAPLDGQVFTVLTTGGTRSGTFTLDDQLGGLLFVKPVVYGLNFVQIEIDSATFCSASQGPIQTPVCQTLDSLVSNPAFSTAIADLRTIDLAQLGGALEALNPTRSHAQSVVGLSAGDLIRNQFGRRSHDLFGASGNSPGVSQNDFTRAQLASSSPSAEVLASAATAALASTPSNAQMKLPNGHGLFFAADGAMTDTNQASSLGKDEAEVTALTAGIDRNEDGIVYGAAVSYLQSHTAQEYGFGGNTTSDGFALSGYGSMREDNLYIDGYASYAWHEFETERRLLVAPLTFATAIGETEGTQTQAGVTAGYSLYRNPRTTIGAVGGLYYVSMDIDGYTETGAGALSAVLPDRSLDSLRAQFGGELAFQATTGRDAIVPMLRVVWNHEFEGQALVTTAGFAGAPAVTFTSPGPTLDSDWATLGVGFSGRMSDGTAFYVRYQTDIGRSGQDNQEVSAAARVAF